MRKDKSRREGTSEGNAKEGGGKVGQSQSGPKPKGERTDVAGTGVSEIGETGASGCWRAGPGVRGEDTW